MPSSFAFILQTAKDWKDSRKKGLPLLILSERAESWLVVAVAPKVSELNNPHAHMVYSKFRLIYTMAAKAGNVENFLKFESNIEPYTVFSLTLIT